MTRSTIDKETKIKGVLKSGAIGLYWKPRVRNHDGTGSSGGLIFLAEDGEVLFLDCDSEVLEDEHEQFHSHLKQCRQKRGCVLRIAAAFAPSTTNNRLEFGTGRFHAYSIVPCQGLALDDSTSTET